MDTMYKNYDALRSDLQEITRSADTDQKTKGKATELFKYLQDKTMPVVVAEFTDFLSVFELMSTRFQSKSGLMIGNVEIIRDGYKDFENLKKEYGTNVQEFLSKCSCRGVCTKGRCTLAQYDSCPVVTRDSKVGSHSLTTRTDGEHTIKLSQFRTLLYENMQKQLVQYFDPGQLESFEIFNPKNFKIICGESVSCEILSTCYDEMPTIVPSTTSKPPEDNFRTLCQFYHISSCEPLITEWKVLLSNIVREPQSQELKDLDAAQYWPKQMQRTDLPLSVALRGLLERVLVTSFTSADAERAFSMVSHIKSPSRQSLSPKSLENLLRIKFNGPSVLSTESLYAYTKEFVKKTSRVDDTSVIGGPKPRPDAYKNYFSKSKIF